MSSHTGFWNDRQAPYPESDFPVEGLIAALKTVTLHANQSAWAAPFGHAPAVPGCDPAQALSYRFKIEATLDQLAAMRTVTADANNFLYLIRANQLARADPRQIKAPTLILYSPTDLVVGRLRLFSGRSASFEMRYFDSCRPSQPVRSPPPDME